MSEKRSSGYLDSKEYRECLARAGRLLSQGAELGLEPVNLTRLRKLQEALPFSAGTFRTRCVILLLAGTGVGKSTLLNALAGSELAETSVLRPCTTHHTVYFHRDTPVSLLSPYLDANDTLIPHDREELRHKIVIDPPDFDSVVQKNRQKLFRLLGVADVAICMVDAEKYKNESLFEIISSQAGKQEILFLFNKIDLEGTERAEADFRAYLSHYNLPGRFPLLRVSAAEALRRKLGGTPPYQDGDFEELEEIISRRVDQALLEEIKSANATGVLQEIGEGIQDVIPVDLEDRLALWEQDREKALGNLADRISLSCIERGYLPHRRWVHSVIRGRKYSSHGLLFGLYLRGVDRLNTVFRRQYLAGGDDAAPELDLVLRQAFMESSSGEAAQEIETSFESILASAGAQGIPRKAFSDAAVEDSAARIAAGLGEELRKTLTGVLHGARASDSKSKLPFLSAIRSAMVGNLLPAGVVGYGIYRFLDGIFFSGPGMPSGFITDLLILLAVVLVGQHALLEQRIRRYLTLFDVQVRAAVRERVRSLLESEFGAELARRSRCLKEYAGEAGALSGSVTKAAKSRP